MSYVLTASDLPFLFYGHSRASWGGFESDTGQLIKSWEYTTHSYYQDKDGGIETISYEKNDNNSIKVFVDWDE